MARGTPPHRPSFIFRCGCPSILPHRASQEFLVDHDVEVRGASRLNRSAFVAILEKMFKGCTEPPEPPKMLTEEFKRKREKAAMVRTYIYAAFRPGTAAGGEEGRV